MYTIRTIPPSPNTDARGLTLEEAFVRIMALADRQYMFTRTARVMHLLMTNVAEDEPEFLSEITVDLHARRAIMAQICDHGLGLFTVMTDEQYRLLQLAEEWAA
jgi:hypothetical protein